MKRGYARVSTLEQDLGRQIQALQNAGCEMIYQDKITGSTIARDDLNRMIQDLQPGDVVVVQKLDRISRSLRDLLNLIDIFDQKQVNFMSLGDNFDNSSPIGRMSLQILGVFAEFERAMIKERTKNALSHKKAQGVVLGRPNKFNNPDTVERVKELRAGKRSIHGIARDLNISIPTVYKILDTYSIV